MSCDTKQIYVQRGDSADFPFRATNQETGEVLPLPADHVRADFRAAPDGPLLLRLTTENGGFIVDPDDAATIVMRLSPANTLALAPANDRTAVLFQIEFRDALVDPAIAKKWPVTTLVLTPVITHD